MRYGRADARLRGPPRRPPHHPRDCRRGARRRASRDGEAQLRVERFGLTANNVTYGVFGDAMGYWQFFPAGEEGWGRVPVWGFASSSPRASTGIEAGERFYGYFPMPTTSSCAREPAAPGFVDAAAHRARAAAGLQPTTCAPPPDAGRTATRRRCCARCSPPRS